MRCRLLKTLVFNVFNNRHLNYNYLFQRPTPTNPNLALQYYEQYGIDDPEHGVRYLPVSLLGRSIGGCEQQDCAHRQEARYVL